MKDTRALIRQVQDDPSSPVAWGARKGGEGRGAGNGPGRPGGRCTPSPRPGGGGLRGLQIPKRVCGARAGGGVRPPREEVGRPRPGRAACPHLSPAAASAAPVRWRSRLSDHSRKCGGPGTQSPAGRGGRSLPARAREADPTGPHDQARGAGGALPLGLGVLAAASDPSPLRPLALGPGTRPRSGDGSREAGAQAAGARGPGTRQVGTGAQPRASRPRPLAAPRLAAPLSASPASALRGSGQVRGRLCV